MPSPDYNPASDNQWPEATIAELITMCSQPALIGLGIIPAPGQDTAEVDLPLARHFIDLLALLNDKTEGQLEDNDQLSIDQTLHELRMAFVQVQDAQREGETETETETDQSATQPAADESSTPDVESDTTVDPQPGDPSPSTDPPIEESDTAKTSAEDD